MKIAHCTQFSAPKGGVEQAVWTLSDYFVRAGHHVDILSYDGQKPSSDRRARKARVKKVEIMGITKHSRTSLFIYRLSKNLLTPKIHQLLLSRYASWQLQKHYINNGRYDIVFFHTQNFVYFRHIKCPHIIVFHGWPWNPNVSARHAKGILYRRILRAMVRNKTILTVSEHLRARLIHLFNIDPNAIHCVGNPVDPERIRTLAAEKIPEKIDRPYIISVARLAKDKAHDVLIKGYAESAVANPLIFVGEGPLEGQLRALASHLGIAQRVKFLGHRDNPFPYIKKAELLVLSSKEEGFGLVLLEALFCGTRVLASDNDGCNEIMSMGGRAEDCLFPAGDHHALASGIRSALKATKAIDLEPYRRFSGERVAQTYLHHARQSMARFPKPQRSSQNYRIRK